MAGIPAPAFNVAGRGCVTAALAVAVHTHRIVRAKLDEQAARRAVQQAIADAADAGISPRVLRRAVRRLDPRERQLDEDADALLEVAGSVAFGRCE